MTRVVVPVSHSPRSRARTGSSSGPLGSPLTSTRRDRRRPDHRMLAFLLFVVVMTSLTYYRVDMVHHPKSPALRTNSEGAGWIPVEDPRMIVKQQAGLLENGSDALGEEQQVTSNGGASSWATTTTTTRRYDQTAAICMLVRSEPQYIEEFVDYHLALGFSNVYIYDNSLDYELELYEDAYPQTEIVHFNNTGPQRQILGQKRCVNQHAKRDGHTWVALIDVDEYLVLKKHAHVIDFLREACPNGSVSMNWVRFGTANRTSYEPLPLTYRFQYRIDMSRIVKSIVHVPSYVRNRSPHWVYLKEKGTRRDPHGTFIKGDYLEEYGVYNPSWNSNGTIDIAAIHHYMYKSLEEYTQKRCKRGRMSHEYNQVNLLCQNFTLDSIPRGDIHDDLAWQFLKKHVPKYQVYEGIR